MNILTPIIRKVLFLEVRTNQGSAEGKLWLVTRRQGGKFSFNALELDDKNLKKYKHGLAILVVTGDEVVEKPYEATDPSFKKITENEHLIWNINHQSSQGSKISFIRKDILEDFHHLLKGHSVHKVSEYLFKECEIDKEAIVESFFKETVNIKSICKDAKLLNSFSHAIYQTLQLPVLLTILALLLGNFYVNSNFRSEYEEIQTQLNAKRKNEKQLLENKQKIGRMEKHYQNFYSGSLALIADRIASYVPTNVSLNLCSIFPLPKNEEFVLGNKQEDKTPKNIVLVKGEVQTPGSVTLFTELLGADKMFSKVEMLSLERLKDQDYYSFELQITL